MMWLVLFAIAGMGGGVVLVAEAYMRHQAARAHAENMARMEERAARRRAMYLVRGGRR